jgi:hypothetical protein
MYPEFKIQAVIEQLSVAEVAAGLGMSVHSILLSNHRA